MTLSATKTMLHAHSIVYLSFFGILISNFTKLLNQVTGSESQSLLKTSPTATRTLVSSFAAVTWQQ